MTDREKMFALIQKLNQAAAVYYQGQDELMSNYEYDRLYDELLELEKKTKTVLAGSPSQRVGYEVLSELPKEEHQTPMLSLDKTKSVAELADWLGGQEGLLSWKLDGLTIVLTYDGGKLDKAVTRGNGTVGEVVTNNARVFSNVPLEIPFQGRLVLRGEAVISYQEFERINGTLAEEERYKNPRNLCSGTVRQLNNKVTAERGVSFYAFALVEAQGEDFGNSQENKFLFLKEQGFDVVEYVRVTGGNLEEQVSRFSDKIKSNAFPSDGLVLLMDDIVYGEALGATSKFPRNAMAFKWADETADTTLLEMEWSASRTGLINPVAIFEPVELEGTTVSRASVHNVSIVEQLQLGIGDTIQVYKANMIIPQIARNLTKSGQIRVPEQCPVCGEPTAIHEENGVRVLVCENRNCLAKQIKSIAHFVSRDAMNMEGMSEATIEKLIARGFLHELADLFRLERYRDEIVEMEGFGERSYQKMIQAVSQAREVSVARFLYSLGIPNIGLSNAKMICGAFAQDFDRVRHADVDSLVEIDGVGEVIAGAFVEFFLDSDNNRMVDELLQYINLEADGQTAQEQSMDGLVFVITGSVNHYPNRNALKEVIEAHGGRATGSVTSKTDYLINNDATSNSTKNRKAKELGVEIITEEEFMDRFLGGLV